MGPLGKVRTSVSLGLVLLTAACGREGPDWGVTPLGNSGHSEINVSDSIQRERIKLISQGVAKKGLRSGLLIAGIAAAEGNLAHCWSEATWACQGPVSPSCGNKAVIAGSEDGPCNIKQGGLGMFQFDSGTYDQTLREYGSPILTVEGNAAAVIPFLLKKIKYFPDVAKKYGAGGVKTEKDLAAWLNSITPSSGKKYQDWLAFVSCLYNGSCAGQKVSAYNASTNDLLRRFGQSAFENGNVTDPVDPVKPIIPAIKPPVKPVESNPLLVLEKCQHIVVSRTDNDPINVRSDYLDGEVISSVHEGQDYRVLKVIKDGDYINDPLFPDYAGNYWVLIDSRPRGWISGVYAECQQPATTI